MSNTEYGHYEEIQAQNKGSGSYEEVGDFGPARSHSQHSAPSAVQRGSASPTPSRSQKKGNFISSFKGSIRQATKKRNRRKSQEKIIEEKNQVREIAEEVGVKSFMW